jgi:replicative DNA helicase
MRDPCANPFAGDTYAQRQLTAALLRIPAIIDEHTIIGEYFPEPKIRRIVEVACSQHAKGEAFDEYTIAPHLNDEERAELANIIEEAGDLSLAPSYAASLKRQYQLRTLNAIGAGTMAASSGTSEDPQKIIDEVQGRLDELQDIGARTKTSTAGDAALRVEKKAIETKRRGVPPGLRTGIDPLDESLLALREGQSITVAGATSMGKTSLATNIATNLARARTSVSYFSLEMNAEDLGVRLLAGETGFSVGEILSGRLSEDELSRLREARQLIQSWPLHIEHCPSLDAGQLLRRGRQHRRKYGTALIVVDYIQLMRGRGRSFYEQVSDTTRGLKIAAGELGIPIMSLSQLNRDVERRSDGVAYGARYLKRRPKLSDLRESGSSEQDSDAVMFVHREEVYLGREKPPLSDLDNYQAWNDAISQHRGRADIVLAKQRQGKIAVVPCAYDEVRFRFGRV